jgi:hypothetical protein
MRSRDGSLGTAAIYVLNCRGFIPGWGKSFFSTLQHPDGLCDPFRLLSNGHRGQFPRGWSGRSVKLITQFHVAPKSRMEPYLYSLTRLHAVVLNQLSRGTILPLRYYNAKTSLHHTQEQCLKIRPLGVDVVSLRLRISLKCKCTHIAASCRNKCKNVQTENIATRRRKDSSCLPTGHSRGGIRRQVDRSCAQ